MATSIPVWDSKAGRVTYKGQNYNIVMINNIAKKKLRTAAEEMVLAAYRRATATGTSGYKPQKTVTGSVPKPSTVKQIATKASSGSSTVKPATNWLKAAAAPILKSSGSRTSTSLGGGGSTYTGGGGDYSMGSLGGNYVQSTIPTYNMRSDEELRNEASTAAAGIYNPIMNALRQRQQDYETARQLGRTDLAAQYANQIADLKALALSAETAMKQQQESVNQTYEKSKAELAQQTLNARNTSNENYDELQNRYNDQINQLGIGTQVNPNETQLLRDKEWANAMLQGVGNIGQTGMAAGNAASNSAMAQLIANNASQFGSLQGQAGIMKDQSLRDLDMQTLQNIMQGNVDIGKTQSDWNAKAYELMKALQGTEWSKYMESGNAAFGQGMANAELGVNAANAAASGAASQSQNMNPGQLGTASLQTKIANLSPDKQKQVMEVWNLMLQPAVLAAGQASAPFLGEMQGGQHPAITDFIGDSGSQSMKDDAYRRAWNSLNSRGLVSNSATDPLWVAFREAMQTTMSGNKNYNLGNVNQF